MDPYETLGVSRTAPDSVIRAAYKARIREAHPDSGGNAAEAQRVNDAYAVLTDPARRAKYDREHATRPTSAAPSSAKASPPPAQQKSATVYAGTISRGKAWWKTLPALITGALAAVALVILLIAPETAGTFTNAFIGTTLLLFAVISVARHSRPLVYILAFGVGGVFASVADPWGFVAIIATGVAAITFSLAQSREDRAWKAYLGDVLLTTAESNDNVGFYFVEKSVIGTERSDTLLQRVHDEKLISRTLWGLVHAGSYVLIEDGSDQVLFDAPADAVERALKVRERNELNAKRYANMQRQREDAMHGKTS